MTRLPKLPWWLWFLGGAVVVSIVANPQPAQAKPSSGFQFGGGSASGHGVGGSW